MQKPPSPTPQPPYNFGKARYKCHTDMREWYFETFPEALEHFERQGCSICLSVATYSLFSQRTVYVWLRMKYWDRGIRALRVKKNPDYYSPIKLKSNEE